MSQTKPLIYKKMATILDELEAVPKGRNHPKYKFRGIDDALLVLNPVLAKHKVFMLPCYGPAEFSDAGATNAGKALVRSQVLMELKFVAEDGSEVSCAVPGEGVDQGDKATMKALANALKYAIYYTFCIPTEEKKDSEAFADEEVETKKPRRKEKAKAEEEEETPGVKANLEAAETAVDWINSKLPALKTEEEVEEARDPCRALAKKLPAGSPVRADLISAFKAAKERVSQ